jgi:hypothetical protein
LRHLIYKKELKSEKVDCWNNGKMGRWKDGALGYWVIGEQ